MQMSALFLLLLYVSVTVHECVFVSEPGPGPILFPVWTAVPLNCTVKEGFRAHWSVSLPDRLGSIRTNVDGVTDLLLRRGIKAKHAGSRMSQLIFSGNDTNSPASVNCLAVNSTTLDETKGTTIEVIFYGTPPPPTNVTATATGLGSLNISWSLEFIQEVPVNFTMTARDLNSTSAKPVVITGIKDYHYTFTTESSNCDRYSFQVEAMAAGVNRSAPSEVITESIPSLPDISLAENAVQHSLKKIADNMFKLKINIQNLTLMCQDFPVITYTVSVILSGCNENKTVITSNINAPSVLILVRDSSFVFNIMVANKFGNSTESAPTNILTTDVQNASICLVEGTTYSIQCSYVQGSNAQGCIYFITGTAMGNMTGTIARSNSKGVTVQLDVYDEVLAYDWESDYSTGTVPIKVMGNEVCLTSAIIVTTGGLTSDNSGLSTTLYIFIIIPAVTLFVMLLLVIIALVIVGIKWRRKGTADLDHKENVNVTETVTNGSKGGGRNFLEREELTSNQEVKGRKAAKGPDAHNIKVAENEEVYSSVAASMKPHDISPVDYFNQDPIYSTPLPIGNVQHGEEIGGYTSIVLAKAPAKRVKFKAKPATVNVKTLTNSNPSTTQEENQYSTVSNVPKKVGAEMWRKVARKYHAGDLFQGINHEAQNRTFDVEPESPRSAIKPRSLKSGLP